mmetsp:Transcript_59882/g.125152  ORF Transcript_59882/g.125152 Transcript_59882/m.125152 type:complete len:210 (-) Transcript_59882:186-815(-)
MIFQVNSIPSLMPTRTMAVSCPLLPFPARMVRLVRTWTHRVSTRAVSSSFSMWTLSSRTMWPLVWCLCQTLALLEPTGLSSHPRLTRPASGTRAWRSRACRCSPPTRPSSRTRPRPRSRGCPTPASSAPTCPSSSPSRTRPASGTRAWRSPASRCSPARSASRPAAAITRPCPRPAPWAPTRPSSARPTAAASPPRPRRSSSTTSTAPR